MKIEQISLFDLANQPVVNKIAVTEEDIAAIFTSALEDIKGDKLYSEKAGALKAILILAKKLLDMRLLESLIYTACKKKVDYVLQARTKGEIKEILTPSVSYNDYSGILKPRGRYHIPEEELLYFGIISPNNLLSDAAYNRYFQLVKQIFPEAFDKLELNR